MEDETQDRPLFATARVADDTVPGRVGHEPVPGQVHGEDPEAAAARGVDPRLIEGGDDPEEEGTPSAGTSSSASESSSESSSEKRPTSTGKPARTTANRT